MARPELIHELKTLQNACLSNFIIKDGKRELKIRADRQLLLLIKIHSYFGNNKSSYPGQETLAWNCQWIAEDTPKAIKNGQREVRRTMKALTEQKIVIVKPRGKGLRYFIAFDQIPQRPGATRGPCSEPPVAAIREKHRMRQLPTVAAIGATDGTQNVPPMAAMGATRGTLINQEIPKNTTTTQSGSSSFEEELNEYSEHGLPENLNASNQESSCGNPLAFDDSPKDLDECAPGPQTVDENILITTSTENEFRIGAVDMKKFDDQLRKLGVSCKNCLHKAIENEVAASDIDRFLSDAVEAKKSGTQVEPGLIYNVLNNATKHLPPKHDFKPKPTKNKKTEAEVREYDRQRIVLQLRNRKISQDIIEQLVNKPFSSGFSIDEIIANVNRYLRSRTNNSDSEDRMYAEPHRKKDFATI